MTALFVCCLLLGQPANELNVSEEIVLLERQVRDTVLPQDKEKLQERLMVIIRDEEVSLDARTRALQALTAAPDDATERYLRKLMDDGFGDNNRDQLDAVDYTVSERAYRKKHIAELADMEYWQIQVNKLSSDDKQRKLLQELAFPETNGSGLLPKEYWALNELTNRGIAELEPYIIERWNDLSSETYQEELVFLTRAKMDVFKRFPSRSDALLYAFRESDDLESARFPLKRWAITEATKLEREEASKTLLEMAKFLEEKFCSKFTGKEIDVYDNFATTSFNLYERIVIELRQLGNTMDYVRTQLNPDDCFFTLHRSF